MPSYGEASVMIENILVGSVQAGGLYAAPALYPRLGLRLDLALRHPVDLSHAEPVGEYWMADLAGALRLGRDGPVIGPLDWMGPRHWVGSRDSGGRTQIEVLCDLDSARLERIERHRAGSPLQLSADLWPTLVAGGSRLTASVERLEMKIPQDDWLGFLDGVGYGHVEVVEIRWTEAERAHYEEVMGFLTKARRKIGEGDWDDAVAECRKAIEGVAGDSPPRRDRLKQRLADRTDEPCADLYMAIAAKLRALTSRAHHGSSSRFSRAEAQFALRTTESLVALISDRLHEA